MKTPSGPRKALRTKAADYLFAPGRLPGDRAGAPSTDAPAPWVYVQVIGLLILACFRPLVIGVLQVAQMYGVVWAPHDLRWVRPCQFAIGTVVFFWLSWLVTARTTLHHVSRRRRLVERGAAVACGAVAMYTAAPTSDAVQRGAVLAVFGCTVAWLALEVCRAHAASPSTRFPATAAERLRDWRIADAALLACMAGGGLSMLLLVLLRWIDIDGVPVMEGSQLSALGLDNVAVLGLTVVWTVAIEDIVIVAATTALLTAIRRPAWEIYTLVCLTEVLLHAYLGLPAIGMALYAAGRVWLYRRYQRLLPLMAGHAALDLSAPVQWLPVIYRPMSVIPVAVAAMWIDHRLKKAVVQTRADRHVKQAPPPVEAAASTTGTPHTRDRSRSPVL